ncbi:MAG: FkbM family methyltransferase [Candidatus Omnitrophica bacterium]|nr:FkbM family methyltransferase [Candidatus Omnitrophota bacterium]
MRLIKKYPRQYGRLWGIREKFLEPWKRRMVEQNKSLFLGNKDQDRWVIEEVFHNSKRGRFFLDLAAADGFRANNTLILEKHFGWNGICIEPNPDLYKQLCKDRACTCLNVCVDEKCRQVEYILNGPISGIVADDTENCLEMRTKLLTRARKKKDIVTLETKTLHQILEENNAPKVIDYFSFDVEGAETRIIRNFPFHLYTFLALTIERPDAELNKLLFDNGYVFVKNHKVDSFYVHSSIPNINEIHKEPFSQLPSKSW